jgi:DNA-directed RNA polymerase subunit alpha
MRRTLLSSIPGAAVTSIRVAGALHEFTTLEGVKEDLTDIVLNIKNLVLSSDNDEPSVIYIRKSGAGAVTGADIAVPSGVEVHNPELHIATLNGKANLEIAVVVMSLLFRTSKREQKLVAFLLTQSIHQF